MSEGTVYDWWQRRPLLLDVPIAVGFALMHLLEFRPGVHEAWALLGLLYLALVVRRTRPVVAFGAVTVAMALRVIPSDTVLATDLAFLVALYSLATYGRRRGARMVGLVVAGIGAFVGAFRFTGAFPGTATGAYGFGSQAADLAFVFVACAGLALSAWTLGDLKRNRLQRLADLQERAERIEREQENELQIAVQNERASIAREMHDVVAHALSVIVVQADGAAYAAEHRTDDTRALTVGALKTIGATARDALGETRRLVGVLRDPTSGAELAPTGGLEHLDELVGRVRAAGVPVTLAMSGAPQALPVGVDVAAYRVVQESLTNVIKHAGPGARAAVEVEVTPQVLRITVRDNGFGAVAVDDHRGHGLHGMRERVAVHSGQLTAGPGPAGGFEVLATLPLSEEKQR